MLDKEPFVLLDLRLNWDSAKHKIKNAIHEEADDMDKWAAKYDREVKTVVYCSDPAEKTSRVAALKLKQKGFRLVKVLRGGWAVWESAGLPLQRKNAAPTPRRFISEVLTD